MLRIERIEGRVEIRNEDHIRLLIAPSEGMKQVFEGLDAVYA